MRIHISVPYYPPPPLSIECQEGFAGILRAQSRPRCPRTVEALIPWTTISGVAIIRRAIPHVASNTTRILFIDPTNLPNYSRPRERHARQRLEREWLQANEPNTECVPRVARRTTRLNYRGHKSSEINFRRCKHATEARFSR